MAVVGGIRIFPTRVSHCAIKCRLKSAYKGYSLLKKKADSLLIRFRAVFVKLLENKSKIIEVINEASLSLAEFKYIAGNVNQFILQTVDKAKIKVRSKEEIVAGVRIRSYECSEMSTDPFLYIGLARGGQQILKVKNNYRKVIELLIEMASLQCCFLTLEEVMKMTRRRVSTLQHIIIPQLENTLTYITVELEEYDREELYRMKKVQLSKKRFDAEKSVNISAIIDVEDDDLLF